MQIALSGATGFIGKALVPHLVAQGHSLLLLRRELPENPATEPLSPPAATPATAASRPWPAVSMRPWSPHRGTRDAFPAATQAALATCDAFIHLGGARIADQRWSPARKQELLQSRLSSTAAWADLLRSLPDERGTPRSAEPPPKGLGRERAFLCGSATGYYGGFTRQADQPGGAPLAEQLPDGTPTLPGADFIGQLARDWEASADCGPALRQVLLRTSLVLHPTGGALAKMLPPFRLGLGCPFGSGEQPFPWIHLTDWLGALDHGLRADGNSGTPRLEGPINLAAPSLETNRSFSRTLARTLHRPLWPAAPAPLLRLALGELAEATLLRGTAIEPRALLQGGFRFRYPELAPALADLLGS
jgi:uncharacterized protein (TIGR01777 family)